MKTLENFNSTIISHAALLSKLHDYKRPNDKISYMLKSGELTKLKNGFYVRSDTKSIQKELIANHLYGPSYISGEWALSHYGLLT